MYVYGVAFSHEMTVCEEKRLNDSCMLMRVIKNSKKSDYDVNYVLIINSSMCYNYISYIVSYISCIDLCLVSIRFRL